MTIFLLPLNASAKLLGLITLISAGLVAMLLPGPLEVETRLNFYENQQWEVRQVYTLSPAVATAIESGTDDSVADYRSQLAQLEAASGGGSDANVTYTQNTSADGSTVITAVGIGQGYSSLNRLFFNNQAVITNTRSPDGDVAVSFFYGDLDPTPLEQVGGEAFYSISGQQYLQSNANQSQQNSAVWVNPLEIIAEVIPLAGQPSGRFAETVLFALGGNGSAAQPDVAQAGPNNLIRNGGFEEPWPQEDGVAAEWEDYDNGRAHFAWYEELWPEAVYDGERAQLMEIYEHEPNMVDRVMAIHQTVNVQPSAEYRLTLYAIMRSDADRELRNQDELAMHWGVDAFGEGNYDNVETWVKMNLTEQNRLGSEDDFPDDARLFYEEITGTIRTGPDVDRMTLFIRGIKKFPNNVEVNFDIDEVSLVGPMPGGSAPVEPPQTEIAAEPTTDAAPATETETEMEAQPATEMEAQPDAAPVATPAPAVEEEITLPSSGAVLAGRTASSGIVLFGGLVVVVIGVAATASLLGRRRNL